MQETFTLPEVIDRRRRAGKPWLEFLRVPALSHGIYALPAGGADPQGPHTEDEVYYVVSGRATLRVGSEDRPAPGSVLFVAAGVTHRSHGIEEDLTALVFFRPAERSAASPGPATARGARTPRRRSGRRGGSGRGSRP